MPRYKLYEVNHILSQVALGHEPADLVIKNGQWVNVHTGEIIYETDIAIKKGRIAYVGQADHTIGAETKIIQADGRFLVPGLLDGHMHVESTMLTVTQFAKAALRMGTTGIFMDPHEIANVFGLEGVKLMHDEGANLPLKVFTTIPSCVPSAENLEDAGATLGVTDIKEGMTWDRVAGLGEVMNFPGVVHGDSKMLGEIAETMKANKTVTGHIPAEDERMIQAYTASGVSSCHETVTREQGLAKARLGLHLMIREGTAWQDVKEVIKVITEDHIDSHNVSLVTDDVFPKTLVEQGHLNHVVRRAIEEGVNPITAIQMATINVANYYKMADDLGSLTPGKCADILLIDDLYKMVPSTVITDGEIIFDQDNWIVEIEPATYPDWVKNSIKLKAPIEPSHFLFESRYNSGETTIQGIKVIENSARTAGFTATLNVDNGFIVPDVKKDILTIACIERHHGTGQIGLGFVTGFQIKSGAVASTVAHDHHNLLVMGTNPEDMALAANRLAEIGGGMIVVDRGEVLSLVPLPIAGLMSDQPLEKVVEQVTVMEKAWQQIGCPLHAPFMTFSLIGLPVIPEYRITNRGLVSVDDFEVVKVEI